MKLVSLVVPCYNEGLVLPILYEELCRVTEKLKDYNFEFVFVDDGSSDDTLKKLKELSAKDERVIYISLSRNFGKEAAMYAGFCNAKGDYVASIDADMQDPPSLLPEMLSILETGEYDSVATRRVSRKGEPVVRTIFAKLFFGLINKISDADIVDGARDFRLMKRSMVDAIVKMCEHNRFSKGIFGWVGFRTYWLPFENVERAAGKTKWSVLKLFKYSFDGIISFSNVPIAISLWCSLLFTMISVVLLVVLFVNKLVFDSIVNMWMVAICVIMLVSAVQLFCVSILGQYISKIYQETKNRPHYIVAETNLKDK